MSKQTINIGVPELNQEQLIEITEYIDYTFKKFLFSKIKPNFIDDIDLRITLDKNDELTLTIDVEVSISSFISNLDQIIQSALINSGKALEKKIRYFKENK